MPPRTVLGANTYRVFTELLDLADEASVNGLRVTRMRQLPAAVVSTCQ
jgi:hypothetical protein